MKNILDEEYVECLHSIVQHDESIEQCIKSYSLITQAIALSEDFDDQGKEEFCKFCLLPFLKLIIHLQQLSQKKEELCMRYTQSMLKEEDTNNSGIEDVLHDIERFTRDISMKEWQRYELQEALNSILNQTKRKPVWNFSESESSIWESNDNDSSIWDESDNESSIWDIGDNESSFWDRSENDRIVWGSENQSKNNTNSIWTNPQLKNIN